MPPSLSTMVPVSRGPYSEIYPRQYIALRAPPSPGDAPAIRSMVTWTKHFGMMSNGRRSLLTLQQIQHPSFVQKWRWDGTTTFYTWVSWEDFIYMIESFVTHTWYLPYSLLGAYMEETDVWGTLTEHNSVIFHDNDVSLPKNDMLQILFSIQ